MPNDTVNKEHEGLLNAKDLNATPFTLSFSYILFTCNSQNIHINTRLHKLSRNLWTFSMKTREAVNEYARFYQMLFLNFSHL